MLESILNEKNLRTLLIKLIELRPKNFIHYFTNEKYSKYELKRRVDDAVPLLKDDCYTLLTKIYWIVNDITDFPKCENDGKPLYGQNVKKLKTGYGKIRACCRQCAAIVHQARREASNIRKYGYANPFQFKKDEITHKNIEKYGNACPANNKEIRMKIIEDNVSKYGVEHYQSTTEFKEKQKTTNLEKYGVMCSLQSTDAKEKTKRTNLRKYGCEDYRTSERFQINKRKNLIKKYGEDYRQILWGGKGNYGQRKRAYQFMLNSSKVIPLFEESDYVNAPDDKMFEFECKNCHGRFLSGWDNGKTRKKCPHCEFNGGISKVEHDLFEFIRSIYSGKIMTNNRLVISPLELDEYLPDMKLAIELDGLYWHNDDVKPDYRYHLNKTDMCEKQGIQLIHVFDSEWEQKQDIVKSRLKNLLGVYDKTIYARKCEIRIVKKNESRCFQNINHIQGSVNSAVSIGLFYNNELISLMTFSKCRFDKKHEWELLRFCNKLGYHIPGAAGKLLKYFEKTYSPKSLVSYADRRWSCGKLYKALGFNFIHNSNPNYWYFKQNSLLLESRVKYQKHKLPNLLENFDPDKTEVENMRENGYFRIFDCGNMVFEKIYPDIAINVN